MSDKPDDDPGFGNTIYKSAAGKSFTERITEGLLVAVLQKTFVVRSDADYPGPFIENFNCGRSIKHHHFVLLGNFGEPPGKFRERKKIIAVIIQKRWSERNFDISLSGQKINGF